MKNFGTGKYRDQNIIIDTKQWYMICLSFFRGLTMKRKVRGMGKKLWNVSKLGEENSREKWYWMFDGKCL